MERLREEPIMLCGEPLDLQAIWENGDDAISPVLGDTQVLKRAYFPKSPDGDIDQSKGKYVVLVHPDRVYIFPSVNGIPQVPDEQSDGLFFRADITDNVTVGFNIHTKHADGSYDPLLPRGRQLAQAAMKFLDQHHADSSGYSTITDLRATWIEPAWILDKKLGKVVGVGSDNFTTFYELFYPHYDRRMYLPPGEEQKRQIEAARQTWTAKNLASPLGFTKIASVHANLNPNGGKRFVVTHFERPQKHKVR